jgi:hypothetical protein
MSGRMSLLVTVKGFGSGGVKPSGAFTGSFTCMLSPESRCVAKVDLHGSRPVQTRPQCIVRAAIPDIQLFEECPHPGTRALPARNRLAEGGGRERPRGCGEAFARGCRPEKSDAENESTHPWSTPSSLECEACFFLRSQRVQARLLVGSRASKRLLCWCRGSFDARHDSRRQRAPAFLARTPASARLAATSSDDRGSAVRRGGRRGLRSNVLPDVVSLARTAWRRT